MSTQQPGASRRRRIAGERRGRALSEQETDAGASVFSGPHQEEDADSTSRPLLEKERVTDGDRSVATDRVSSDEPGATPTGWWGSRTSLILLAATLALLLGFVGLAALGLLGTDGISDLNEADAAEQSYRTAPAAAEAAAAAILAYDYKSLDADKDTATRFMTDDFAEKYTETFEKVVRPAAEQNRAKVTATVLASAAVRATDSTARVVVFVDQATTSAASERPKIALNRVEMSMVREGDTWLVDDISSY